MAWAVNPPAWAMAWRRVVGPTSSYIPGLPTAPMTETFWYSLMKTVTWAPLVYFWSRS